MKNDIKKIAKDVIVISIIVVILSFNFVPFSKVFAADDVYIFSSNRKILEIMLNNLYDDYSSYYEYKHEFPRILTTDANMWEPEMFKNNSIIDISSHYGSSGLQGHYDGYALRLEKEYLEWSNNNKNIKLFDFDRQDLGDIKELPDFRMFENLRELYFEFCTIRDYSGFQEAYDSGKLDSIEKVWFNSTKINQSEYNQYNFFKSDKAVEGIFIVDDSLKSDNRKLLERILQQIGENADIILNDGIYSVQISQEKLKNVTSLDFSGLDLNNISKLPNFSLFRNLQELNFENTNLTSLNAFEILYQNGGFNYLPEKLIDFRKNNIYDTQVVNRPFYIKYVKYGPNFIPKNGAMDTYLKETNSDTTNNSNNEDDGNNGDDDNNQINKDISSIEEILNAVDCPQDYINDIKQGRFDRFNDWWTTHADQIVPRITYAQAQILVNELGRLSDWKYSYSLNGYFADMPQPEVNYSNEPAGWYNRKDLYCRYENHKFIAGAHYEEYDGYDNYLGDIDGYVNYIGPDGNWYGPWFGHAEIPVTKNGHYTVFVGFYGSEDWFDRYEFDITDIDTEKPQIKKVQKTIPSGDANGTELKITLHDDQGLKRVVVKKVNSDKSWEIKLDGEKDKIIKQVVSENGTYEIYVEDTSGNSESSKEIVEVDTSKPVPEGNPEVTVNNENGTYNGMPIVREGDTVTINVKANEKIKSIGNPNYGAGSLGAVHLKVGNEYSDEEEADNVLYIGEMQEVTTDKVIPITIKIDENFLKKIDATDSSKAIGVQLYYVRDEYNNVADIYSEDGNSQTTPFSFDNLFFVDSNAPELLKAEIASKGSGRVVDNTYMIIEKGANYVVSLTFNEELKNNPILKIGNSEVEVDTKYYSNNKNEFIYKAEINCDALIKIGNLKENSDVIVKISNIEDKAGFKVEDVVIDENNKFDGKYILHYGAIEKEELHIASTSISPDPMEGDINADGLINSYDEFLLKKSLMYGDIKLTDEQIKCGDLNSSGKIELADVLLLQRKINKTLNQIYKDIETTFKVYDSNNEQVKGSKLQWELKDSKGNIVNNSSDIIIETDEENGTIKIKLLNDMVDIFPMTLKAYVQNEQNEIFLSTIILNNGYEADTALMRMPDSSAEVKQLGDVDRDGYITSYDQFLVMQYNIKLIELDEEQLKLADVDKNGDVNNTDALLILRRSIGINDKRYDSAYLSKTITKGSSVKMEILKSASNGSILTYNDIKTNYQDATIDWQIISNNPEAFNIQDNNDGTAILTVLNEEDAEGSNAIVKAIISVPSEDIRYSSSTCWKVVEPEIALESDVYEIQLGEENDAANLNVSINVDNKKLKYVSKASNIVDVEVDDFGNSKLQAKDAGESIIVVKTDNQEKQIKVNVTKPIESIDVDKNDVEVKQGSQIDVNVTVNPSDATEDLKIESNDANIATVSYDKTTGICKISGVTEGNTQIQIYSESNSDIAKTVNVKVNKLELPKVTDVTLENADTSKVYNVGDELYFRVKFDGSVIGIVPQLKLKFGDYQSVNTAKFVEGLENNTILKYKYTVGQGDNGTLMVEKLSGGVLTDITKNVKVTTSMDNNTYNSTEDNESTNNDYINDGIYKTMNGIIADTTKPTILIKSSVEKESNWLRNGDTIKVQVVSEEKLQGTPKVYFNGEEAKVEGVEYLFTASLPVTSKLADGYVEIKVDNIVDAAGNTSEAIIAKKDNIDEPIIIDNSAPIIASVDIKKEAGKEYKTGESFDIVVNFKDTTNVTKEYITASKLPELNLKFGDKDAKGTIASDYEVGKYVQSIKYTYTVSEEDKGDFKIDSMSGIISDVAGNETDLSKISIMNVIKENDNTNNDVNGSENEDEKRTYSISMPTTGDKIVITACILLTVMIAIILVEYCYKRRK